MKSAVFAAQKLVKWFGERQAGYHQDGKTKVDLQVNSAHRAGCFEGIY